MYFLLVTSLAALQPCGYFFGLLCAGASAISLTLIKRSPEIKNPAEAGFYFSIKRAASRAYYCYLNCRSLAVVRVAGHSK